MGIEQDQSRLSPPEKLNSSHQFESFDSGNTQLDDWLKRRSLKNESDGASRTYVVCSDGVVVGYYCLAVGALALTAATGRIRRNMPDPIPVMVIGRLAIDRRWQEKRLGRSLLRDAILRTLQVSEIAGIRAVLVHAISLEAKQFYEKCGFTASPIDPMTLMVKVDDAINALHSNANRNKLS